MAEPSLDVRSAIAAVSDACLRSGLNHRRFLALTFDELLMFSAQERLPWRDVDAAWCALHRKNAAEAVESAQALIAALERRRQQQAAQTMVSAQARATPQLEAAALR